MAVVALHLVLDGAGRRGTGLVAGDAGGAAVGALPLVAALQDAPVGTGAEVGGEEVVDGLQFCNVMPAVVDHAGQGTGLILEDFLPPEEVGLDFAAATQELGNVIEAIGVQIEAAAGLGKGIQNLVVPVSGDAVL